MSEIKAPDAAHEAALARWMDEYGDALVRLAYGVLKDAYLAQDAAQDAFVKAYRGMAAFRGECSEKAYLTGILMNTCRDYLRTAWMKHVDRRTPPEDLTESYTDAPESDKTVIETVLALPVKLREVILLRYWQNMKIKEVGEALGISPETVKKRLSRANQRLRAQLKEWYDGE